MNLLIDNHPNSMAISDINGIILVINKKLANIFQNSKEELIGTSGFNFIEDKVGKRRSKIIEKVIKTKKPIELIDQHRGKWWKAIFQPIIDKDGNVVKLAYYIQDITKQKQYEHDMIESDISYKQLINAIPDGIIVTDLQGNVKELNKKGLELYGESNIEEVLGTNIFDQVVPRYLENTLKIMEKTISHGSAAFETELFKKDGSKYFVEITTKIQKDSKGKEIALIGSIRDITDRKNSENEIIKTKNYLQKIIDSTSELIFTLDKDFKIKTWNQTAEQITGYKKNNIVGKTIDKINLFEYPENILNYLKDIQNNKKTTIEEISINTKFDNRKIFSISPSMISDESNEIIEFLFVCSDITHEKEVYNKLKERQSYLIEDYSTGTALDIFKDLLKMKYKGLFIGREKKEQIKKIFNKKSPHTIRFSSIKDIEYPTINTPEELYQQIKDFLHKNNQTVILIDRLDYLIINNSFELVMKTLYKINDLVENNKSIMLVNINISYLNNNQTALIRQEIEGIPKIQISDIIINEELKDIIRYVYEENKRNVYVNYGKINKKFSLSKITTKKRIEALIDKGLIISKKHGKTKILFLTNKGNKIIDMDSIN